MKIVHIVPGLDAGASQLLKDEHCRALESISQAVRSTSNQALNLRVVEFCDHEWPAFVTPGVEVFRAPVDVVSVRTGGSIRPKLRSFFPKDLVEAADFVVFTNSDICVTPEFYDTVAELIDQGTLAGSIHRKTVLGLDPSHPESVAEAIKSDNWYLHPGSDCFFFPPATAAVLRESELVMGVPPVGRYTITVLSALNLSFKKFPALGVTFHFGDDKVWKVSGPLRKLTEGNTRNMYLALPRLLGVAGLKGFLRGMATVRVITLRNWISFALVVSKSLIKGVFR